MAGQANLKHNKQRRQRDCQERLEAWQSLSPKQQLDSLDARLGEGEGAVKQRARIIKQREEKDGRKS